MKICMFFGNSFLKGFWEGLGRVLGRFWEGFGRKRRSKREKKERKEECEKKKEKREGREGGNTQLSILALRRYLYKGRQLGHILKKTFKKKPPLEANLGAKISNKSKKIDVRKAFVLRYVFLSDFHRFCVVFGPSKPPFFDNVWL